ncbi:HIT family hydrolase [Halobacteriales archaeon QS_1_67_19]|nr:MAG: HIT family hydrolase [Halobacteriales archaeon QS_1_67_19]
MEQVFAPWRIEWIEREDKNEDVDECVFCELPTRGADRENLIVARSDRAFVMLNNYPYNPGHAMVVPREHTGDYRALSEADLLEHARLKQRTFDALADALDPDGFNAGLNLGRGAGGSIGDHLHTHVVPRWEGDTNFMPVVSDTKVIVEAVDETYDRVREAFEEQEGVDGSSDGAVQVE